MPRSDLCLQAPFRHLQNFPDTLSSQPLSTSDEKKSVERLRDTSRTLSGLVTAQKGFRGHFPSLNQFTITLGIKTFIASL